MLIKLFEVLENFPLEEIVISWTLVIEYETKGALS